MTTDYETRPVTPPVCDYTKQHPQWCTMNHRPGANPRRQRHLSTWQSTHGETLAMTVDLYPLRGDGKANPEPAAFFTVTVDHGDHRGRVDSVLRLRDLRSLAQRITEIADAAEAETTAWADANGIEVGEL